MKYQGIIISDIHFGAIDCNQLRDELVQVFLYYLENMKKIDFIVFTGDYFDHKLYINDRNTDYALAFMDKVVDVSRKNNCPIRIVYGTESHEVNQYNIFSIYENDPELDFKIIKTASDEELLKGMNVLYLPEEYVYNKKEYYNNYLTKKEEYDYVFGHGVIQEIMSNAVNSTRENKDTNRKKVPYFTCGELSDMCKGQVYFGHYHINKNINNKIFYVGSYSRFSHGEEEPKGFYHVTYDLDKNKYDEKFIENYMAKKYVTHIYGYNDEIMKDEDSLLKELDRLDKLTQVNQEDYVRVVVNIPENHENPEFIINIINERYKQNDNVKLKISNGYVEKKKKINKEKLNDTMNEYPLIFDKNASLENKLEYFIQKRYDVKLDLDHIKNHLYGTKEE